MFVSSDDGLMNECVKAVPVLLRTAVDVEYIKVLLLFASREDFYVGVIDFRVEFMLLGGDVALHQYCGGRGRRVGGLKGGVTCELRRASNFLKANYIWGDT